MASALAFAPAMAKNIDQMADLMTRNGLPARFTGNTASSSSRIESFFLGNICDEVRNSSKDYQQSLKNNTI